MNARIIPLVTIALSVLGPLTSDHGQPSYVAHLGASSNLGSPADYGTPLRQYCFGCHSQRVRAGGLALDGMDLGAIAQDAEVWERVLRKLRNGAMPPVGSPRPDRATYEELITWLETSIDRAAGAIPNPGYTLLHRLNRAEYANAIRDLLALNVEVASLLPPDDSSYAFDNVADVLGVSPALQERYLSAAEKVSALAVGAEPSVAVAGGHDVRPSAVRAPHTPSRRRIFSCHPVDWNDEARCARQILSPLARRAFRRPVDNVDLHTLVGLFQKSRVEGASFDGAIAAALQTILVDPEFMFRIERTPDDAAPGAIHRISDLELASRLSFFLWSSIPDAKLLTLASHRKLSQSKVLSGQVHRLLTDARAEALVSNFAGQWLQLRNLPNRKPSRFAFPTFDENLPQDFRREAELFFQSIIEEDRSVLDLVTADYTFINERLARHYGIPKVYGSHFRRVVLADENRHGLLGKGSTLLVTSYAERTSPVLRGKWILENLLGIEPPAPPPDVPEFPETGDGAAQSVRERLELHRSNPVCASCHKLIDPLGLALENFDAVGAWRTNEGGRKIDASEQLLNGAKVDGPITLRMAIIDRPQNFVQTFTEKLMIYALGRGLVHSDMPTVRRIVQAAARDNYRFSAIVSNIVQSTPFTMRKVPVSSTTGTDITAAGR